MLRIDIDDDVSLLDGKYRGDDMADVRLSVNGIFVCLFFGRVL